MPVVELPAGSRGRLELSYLPAAVVYGVAVSVASLLVLTAILVFSLRRPPPAAA